MIFTLSEEIALHHPVGREPVGRGITRRLGLITLGAVVILVPTACSSASSTGWPAPSSTAGTGEPEPGATLDLSGRGTLAPPGQISNAFTYDPTLAPVGARLTLTMTSSSGSTRATLDTSGLLPNRGYAVHLHSNPCGLVGDASGPHFQHHVDPAATPEAPSTDPEFANGRNEIWLDVRTDATGAGRSSADVPFPLTDRVPASVVVHEEMVTAMDPGKAGSAGDRIACFTLPSK